MTTVSKQKTNLKISDLARHAGVSISTIRAWERQKLLAPSYTATGRRVYRQSDLELALAIRRMRIVEGMNIADIKSVLAAQSSKETASDGVGAANDKGSDVGSELRRLRLSRGLSIRHVAEQVGVDPSMLASVERTSLGIDMPLLKQLSQFFGVTLNHLMGTDVAYSSEGRELITHQHGVLLPRLGLGIAMERLCSGHGVMTCKRWRIDPGVHSNGSYRHEGEEFLILISGEFELTIDNERVHRLSPGDTAYFPSDLYHSWRNPGKEAAELIWIVVGSGF